MEIILHKVLTMKIAAFYHLSYPDVLPDDLFDAATITCVEILTDDDEKVNSPCKLDFSFKVAINVMTIGHLLSIVKQHGHAVALSAIVVESMADATVEAALEANIGRLSTIGQVIEGLQ